MATTTATTAARRHFDQAMAAHSTHSSGTALRLFCEATEADPSMADAWLGRLASGDDQLATLERLHDCRRRLHRESNRIGVALAAAVKTGPYLSITVTEASHAAIAFASALIDGGQFDQAEEVLDDPDLLDSEEIHQWRQYVQCYLMFATQRWHDVIVEAARMLPPEAIVMPAVSAGVYVLSAHSAAHLGQARVALEWADRVELRSGVSTPARMTHDDLADSAISIVDPGQFPLIAADLAYVRGMAHRQLGDEVTAQVWLSKAAVNGVLLGPARQALADPCLHLAITNEETINSRTDRWDPHTAQSDDARLADENAERRTELLTEGRALLNNQVGLYEVKRAVAELEDQMEVRALRLAHGLPVSNQTNHMLLVGPPGTGKTTTAEALGKIFAGLGIVKYPDIIEVKRSDFCGEHIGSSGPKTNELINRSLGRILFLDEMYSLIERHHDGRPDMIGMEAVHQLMVALEVHRFAFCFIGAGYEKEVDQFLAVNPGLAGRFNRKLRFTSYSPDELVEIAVRYGQPRATLIDPDAQAALNAACRQLGAYLAPDGSHGIDLMHNGRFARNVVERAERLRDSRVAAKNRAATGSVTIADLETLRTEDILTAVADACAEKHVPTEP